MLYLGDSFDPEMHRHHAVQCCIALEGEMRISSRDGDEWTSCSSTVIPSNARHRIANPEGAICILYLEKTSEFVQLMPPPLSRLGGGPAAAHLEHSSEAGRGSVRARPTRLVEWERYCRCGQSPSP